VTKILAIGDVMGKVGRQCLETLLPTIREQHQPDFVVVNGENAAGGFGLTEKIYRNFTEQLHIDAVTMGNHWHDKREIYSFLPRADRLVLPCNMGNVESDLLGLKIITAKNGQRLAVINCIGRAFMKDGNRDIFKTVDKLLQEIPSSVRIRIVDIHAEATSEKQALGWYLAGRASLVYGTHSHVPTADHRLLEGKTGFVTDVGMTGPYRSVIGIDVGAAIHRLLTGEKKKFEPATADPRLYAIMADIDDDTGHCREVQRLHFQPTDM
jgi:metallophosphoesterase (TIGR00282 family)